MGPLLLLGLSGLTSIAGGVGFNRLALSDENLKPKVWGADARHVGIGLGLLGALLGGPIGAAVGLGLASSAVVSMDTSKQVRTGLESFIKAQVEAQAAAQLTAAPSPAQIPGPMPAPALPVQPQRPGLPMGLINTFANLFQPQAA